MIEYENLKLLNQPFLEEFKTSFSEILESGWFILGKKVVEFEKKFADFNSRKYCLGVANGLDALILSLKALSLPVGGEVIVPSNTYIASILAIVQCGLIPVLVEPDLQTYNIDPNKIEEAITPFTCAVLVVHLYGKCCEMDRILSICQSHQLKLLEDCAQSHGAKFKNKISGSFGDFSAFSFYPTKNLGALGDGGAVLCDDPQGALCIKRLRNYGSDIKYFNEVIGYNSRLDEIQAGFLLVKFKNLDQITAHKRKLAGIYLNHLKKDFILPQVRPDYFDVYHIFNIRHPKRDQLKEYLLKGDIKTEIHYPGPPHRQKAMKGILTGKNYPISEEIHQTTLSLPCSLSHSEEDIFQVVERMNQF
ncbi:MAG: DegT/DnrJ/EryC1/StrS family aminotransferase [Chitinophagaceae bacterium]